MRIFRKKLQHSFNQQTYESTVSAIRRIITSHGREAQMPAKLELVTEIIANEYGLPIAAVDADFAMPKNLAVRVRALRHAVTAPDWPSITAWMHAHPQHIRYDPHSPARLIFDAEAAGASDLIQHMLRRHDRYASDLAAEVLHDVDPVRNQMRLATLERLREARPKF